MLRWPPDQTQHPLKRTCDVDASIPSARARTWFITHSSLVLKHIPKCTFKL